MAKSFNLDNVRRAFEEKDRAGRTSGMDSAYPSASAPYRWVREVWTDHLIVETEGSGKGQTFAKVPFTVKADGSFEFGDEVPVRQEYVELAAGSELLWRESAQEKLLRLAGSEHVSGYMRRGKRVKSYQRSPGKANKLQALFERHHVKSRDSATKGLFKNEERKGIAPSGKSAQDFDADATADWLNSRDSAKELSPANKLAQAEDPKGPPAKDLTDDQLDGGIEGLSSLTSAPAPARRRLKELRDEQDRRTALRKKDFADRGNWEIYDEITMNAERIGRDPHAALGEIFADDEKKIKAFLEWMKNKKLELSAPDSGTIALAGTERVSGYKRTTKSGKTVSISAYTRSPGDMDDLEIQQEIEELSNAADGPDRVENARRRTRLVALEREQAKRVRENQQPGKPQPSVPGGVTPPPQTLAEGATGPSKLGFDQKAYQQSTGVDNLADEAKTAHIAEAKSALGSVDSFLESYRQEDDGNGPRGWDEKADVLNSMSVDIATKIKRGDYDEDPRQLQTDLEDLAQEMLDSLETTDPNGLEAVAQELLEASDTAASIPQSRIASIRERRQGLQTEKPSTETPANDLKSLSPEALDEIVRNDPQNSAAAKRELEERRLAETGGPSKKPAASPAKKQAESKIQSAPAGKEQTVDSPQDKAEKAKVGPPAAKAASRPKGIGPDGEAQAPGPRGYAKKVAAKKAQTKKIREELAANRPGGEGGEKPPTTGETAQPGAVPEGWKKTGSTNFQGPQGKVYSPLMGPQKGKFVAQGKRGEPVGIFDSLEEAVEALKKKFGAGGPDTTFGTAKPKK